ncbi:MAG: ATP-binding protein [Nitrosomonas sp.]|nr:MAG: ATP-binding protein [Nitrosomonas sp.]
MDKASGLITKNSTTDQVSSLAVQQQPFIPTKKLKAANLGGSYDPPRLQEDTSAARLKKIACLYAISREMIKDQTIEELCSKLVKNMQAVWDQDGKVFPGIEICGKHFGCKGDDVVLPHQASIPIVVNEKKYGHIYVYFDADKVGSWEDEEDSVLLQNIANDLGTWLARMQADNRLSVSREKEINIIASVFDEHSSITITDKDGIIEYVNNKFCEICKYAAEELIGQDIRIINSNYHSQEFMREMWNTIIQGKVWKGEFRNRAKDGSIYWLNTTIVPFRDDSGSAYRYVAIRTEVTEYKEMEQRMEEQVAELARSNDELEQFAYVVTHDLQEPLRAVSSFVQLLKRYCDQQLDRRANELIANVIDGTSRMQLLINDLLTYAQVNTDQAMVDIDCSQLLKNVLTDLSIIINENGATITYDSLPVIKGIPFQFSQLFYNLISNAIKFRGRNPPEVHIGVKEESIEWVFFVSDNGIGIEVQYWDRVFRVFQRLHSRKEYAGTGIGLAICKKVIDQHKGRIWVKSEPNVGSVFYFTIAKIK